MAMVVRGAGRFYITGDALIMALIEYIPYILDYKACLRLGYSGDKERTGRYWELNWRHSDACDVASKPYFGLGWGYLL